MSADGNADGNKKTKITSLAKGELLVCGTPIGNLQDITLRVLECLDEVDMIICEDTRHSSKILYHYEKEKKRLISYHRHSPAHRLEEIKDLLCQGYRLALLADAGMPGISDPGSLLVREAMEMGIDVKVLPGPSSVTAALSLSGYPANSFLFFGFLSSSTQKRNRELSRLAHTDETVVLMETPHRLKKTLAACKEKLGHREMVVMKELTKRYEKIVRGSPEVLLDYFSEDERLRGEYILIFSPREKDKDASINEAFSATESEDADRETCLKEDLRKLLAAGLPPTQAAKSVSLLRKVHRKEVYQLMIEMKDS